MLHVQTLFPDTLELLKQLAARPEMQGLRLVGDTSLALQYGHRQSVDLDFFGNPVASQDELLAMMESIGNYRLRNRTHNILQLVVNNVMVDIVDYSQYPWITPPIIEDSLILASPQDIAAMKINAIEGRGSRKDFIDLYILLQHFTLEEILSFYSQKYPNYSIFRALLSLTYFDDAEAEAMPRMLIPDSWDTMKTLIISKVRSFQNTNRQ